MGRLIRHPWRNQCEGVRGCPPISRPRARARRRAACSRERRGQGRDRATPAATAWAERAAAAVALHDGEPARAAALALTSATDAKQVQAPIEAALSRTVADRALAQAVRPCHRRTSARGHGPRRVRRAALPRRGGTGAGKVRPPRAPTHQAREDQRNRHRVANQTRTAGGTDSSSSARPTRRQPRSCTSARRPLRPTCATSSTRSMSHHVPQDQCLITRRPGACDRARRPNGEPATDLAQATHHFSRAPGRFQPAGLAG